MNDLGKVSVIMPVFNEKSTIAMVIEKVTSLSPKEIIVVDDHSTDGTREILGKFAKENKKLKIIYHDKNQGKGAAIRTALKYVTGDIVAVQDADLEYNPEEIGKLAGSIISGEVSVVYGSRFLNKPAKNIYKRYKWGNWFLSKIVSILCGQKITDSYTCYKVLKTSVLKNIELKSKRFEIEAEITVKLLKKGIKILELPISYNPRRLEEGKKIGWLDAVKGIYTIIRFCFWS